MASKTFVTILLFVSQFYGSYSQEGHKTKDWWQKTIMYQIYPRSFKDSNGDGIGDLKGITSKLSHLKETGIGMTWLSPIFQSPMVDGGYDISNFTAIHDEYGTMQDLEDLLEEAKKLGIKIILDFVPNHTSDMSEWFIKSVNKEDGYEDFYVWHDGIEDEKGNRVAPNNWQSCFRGSAWSWNEKRQQYYLHQFAKEQPDLNYRNPNVLKAMNDVLTFWLDKGVDGFRVDAINHMFEDENFRDEPETGWEKDPNSYDFTHHIYTKDLPETNEVICHWRMLLDDYKEANGGTTRIMLTEAYTNITCTVEYYETKDGCKGSHVPMNFLLITDLNKNSDARDFVFNIEKWLSYMPIHSTANWVLGNHDNSRVGTRYGKDRIDAMNMFLLTLPGIAVSYNGDEIGMVDYDGITWEQTQDPIAVNSNPEVYKSYSRDPERTPFQWDGTKNGGFSDADSTWLPVHPDYENLNLALEKEHDRSHYKLYQRLANLRTHPTLQDGNIRPMALNRRILAYKRELKGHDIFVIVINLGDSQETVDLQPLGDLPEILNAVAAASESNYKEGDIIRSKKVILGPFDCLTLQQKPISRQETSTLDSAVKVANFTLFGLLLYFAWKNELAIFQPKLSPL